jgi:hypothetical protein
MRAVGKKIAHTAEALNSMRTLRLPASNTIIRMRHDDGIAIDSAIYVYLWASAKRFNESAKGANASRQKRRCSAALQTQDVGW